MSFANRVKTAAITAIKPLGKVPFLPSAMAAVVAGGFALDHLHNNLMNKAEFDRQTAQSLACLSETRHPVRQVFGDIYAKVRKFEIMPLSDFDEGEQIELREKRSLTKITVQNENGLASELIVATTDERCALLTVDIKLDKNPKIDISQKNASLEDQLAKMHSSLTQLAILASEAPKRDGRGR